MKIIVFDRDEKRIADLNPESVQAPLIIEDNEGLMTFQFNYSIKEEDVQALQGGNYIAFLDELENVWKEYEITSTNENSQFISVSCDHRYTELATEELVTWSVDGAEGGAYYPMTYSLQGTRWKVGTIENQRSLKRAVFEKNPLEALRYIEKEWGGVLRFRVEITGSGNHDFFVDLLERRGSFTGNRLEFGHNLKDFEHSVDFRLIKTAMYGRGKGQSIEGEEDTAALTFADIAWSVAAGDPVDKPLGQTWVGFEDKRLQYGKPDGQGGRKHAFGRWDSQAETQEGLLWETYFKLQEASEPVVNVRASVLDLEKLSPDFAHEQARLGDENFLIARYEGRDISLVAEIIRTERNPDDYSQTVVELGNYLPVQSKRLAKMAKEVSLQQARAGIYERAGIITQNGTIPTGVLEGVIDAVQNEFHSSSGFVYQTGNGILILNDDRDTGNPTKALFLSGGSLYLSNEKGADGQFIWRTFGDGDGFVADEIVTGTLDANLVSVINLNANNINAGKIKAQFVEISGQSTFADGYDPSQKLETVFQTTPPTDTNVIWVDTTDANNPQWKVYNKALGNWVLGPSGPRGPQGLQGLQGPQGDQGLQGPAGTSSYTHIAYATNSTGTSGFSTSDSTNKTYIGMYVDSTPTDSTDPTKYKWTLIKGADGAQGIEGPQGADGQTPYLHIAYANSADGLTGFSVSESLDKIYIGTYTDFTAADSTDPTKYSWTKIKGDQGPQGVQGPKGDQGATTYTWIKYADSPTSGMSDDPTGKKYLGIAYNKTTPNESTTYSDYSWSLTEGKQGIQGPAGADGVTTYTWIKYADDQNGGGMSDDPQFKKYIGIAYNKTTATESTNTADYAWSLISNEFTWNLLKNTALKTDESFFTPTGGGVVTRDTTVKNGDAFTWKYNVTGRSTDGYVSENPSTTPLNSGDIVSTSAEVYIPSTATFDGSGLPIALEIQYFDSTGARITTVVQYADMSKLDQWQRVEINNKTAPTGTVKANARTWLKRNGAFWSSKLKLELNKKANAWTPHQDDLIGVQGAQGLQGPQGIQGPKGDQGATTYTWIKYADNSSGGGMSDSPTGKLYMGIAYNKTTSNESTNAADYAWSLIKGDKGDQGIQGPTGPQGQATYTWIKYADDQNGGGMSDSPDNKKYIGIAYNKTTQTESTTASDYAWSLISNTFTWNLHENTDMKNGTYAHNPSSGVTLDTTKKNGENNTWKFNVTGLAADGWRYDNPWAVDVAAGDIVSASAEYYIPTNHGIDVSQPRLEIEFLDASGVRTGIYSTFASLSILDQWQRIELNKITAPTGTTKVHARIGLQRNGTFWGAKLKLESGEQSNEWTPNKKDLIGLQGPQGVQGPKGDNGQSLYTWVKYADTSTGGGMSDSPTGKLYIGLAYNKTSATESATASDYTWSLIKGDQGAQGPAGADGVTTYTWVKYGDDSLGNGMSDSPDGKRYLGLAYNKTTPTESTNKADYQWSPLYDNVVVGGTNLLTKTDITVDVTNENGTAQDFYFDWEFGDVKNGDLNYLIGKPIVYSFLIDAIGASANIGTDSLAGRFGGHCSVTWYNADYTASLVTYPCNMTTAFKGTAQRAFMVDKLGAPSGYPNLGKVSANFQIHAYPTGSGVKWTLARPKLELGNVPTEWNENPSDTAQKIDDKIGEVTTAYQTAIKTSEDSITLEVNKTLYGGDGNPEGTGGLKGDMISYTDSKVTQTDENFNVKFTTMQSQVDTHEDNLAEVYSYFDFSDTGLNIGKSDSPLQINISNEQMDFIDNGNVVAYVNGQKMYISTAEILNSIIVGNHKIEKYNSSITIVKWVG